MKLNTLVWLIRAEDKMLATLGIHLSVQFPRHFAIMFISRTLEGTRSMDKQDLKNSKVIRDPMNSGKGTTQFMDFGYWNPPLHPY